MAQATLLKRKRKHDLRIVMDAFFYILRTGCQCRNSSSYFPKWQTVYWYFNRWKKQNILSEINCFLNQIDKIREDRNENSSVLCIDSQSVKLSPMIFENRGIDANKKINVGPPIREEKTANCRHRRQNMVCLFTC